MIEYTGNNLWPVIRSAESVLFIFGAGMSTDSGIPDYRSSGGWYTENGPFAAIDKTAFKTSMRSELITDWHRAWGIWGYKYEVISRARPHIGYKLLAKEAAKAPLRTFVLTSNSDEMAIRAGFSPERVHQCHGSRFRLQCSVPCSRETWRMPEEPLDIDAGNFLLKSPLPRCLFCGAVARPNVYFFGDSEESYVWQGSQATAEAFSAWIAEQENAELLMLEIGCGLGAPGLRRRAERYLAEHPRSLLIRINDSAAMGPPERFIGIQDRALHALFKDTTFDDRVFDEEEYEIPSFIRRNDSFGDLVWGKGIAPFMAGKSDARMVVHIGDKDTEVAVYSFSGIVYSKRIHADEKEVGGILLAVRAALKQAPPELAADIVERGIILAGGTARFKGLDRLLHEEILKKKTE